MEGVTLHPLKHITVPKGDIYHAMKSTDEGYCGFGEAYFSQIEQGQAKRLEAPQSYDTESYCSCRCRLSSLFMTIVKVIFIW